MNDGGFKMKELISKFIRLTFVLGTLSIPVLAHADDQSLIKEFKGQLFGEVQNTERELVDSLTDGNNGQKQMVQPQVVVQENQTILKVLTCALEKKNLADCEASDDEDKDCQVQAEALIQCEEKAMQKAMDQNEPPKAFHGN
jgi:hypothetical protein